MRNLLQGHEWSRRIQLYSNQVLRDCLTKMTLFSINRVTHLVGLVGHGLVYCPRRSRWFTRFALVFGTFYIFTLAQQTTYDTRTNASRVQLPGEFGEDGSFGRERNESQKTPSKGFYYDSMPSSFAILINLGLDGQSRNMYSSHSYNDICEAQQIWDPFSKQCRQLYCKDHFEIKNLKCVNDNKANSSDDKSKPFIKFLDSKSKFVNVTLGFRSNQEISESWVVGNQMKIISQFSKQFSSTWSLDANRIINVTVQYVYQFGLNINFLIMDSNDIKNDYILPTLSQNVILKQQKFSILAHTLTALSIHTTLVEINDFCSQDTDMPIWYWNSDFTIMNRNNLTFIYVNKTGRIYYPGEYMGSVLCVESIDERGQSQLNVSSNSVVCEQTLIDETCPRILLNRSEYEFVDGRHLYSKTGHYFDKYELTDNQSVFVCLSPPKAPPNADNDKDSLDARIESILSTSLMVVSISLLTLVLVTFLRHKSLRTTINGFNSINLVVCLEVMQITFLLNQFIHQCRVSAVMFHFFILATISWSSVIAYDMHRVFVSTTLVGRPNSNKIRLIYCTVAYLVPALIVTVANVGDIFELSAIRGEYGPVLHSHVCWMRRRAATIAYFIVPVAFTVFCNFVLYLRIICNIRSEIKSFSSFKKVTRIPSSSSSSSTISVISSGDSSDTRLAFNQTSIYTRLSVPLGFTWIVGLCGCVVPSEYTLIIRILSYLFIIANTSQGITLFLAFGEDHECMRADYDTTRHKRRDLYCII